MCWELMVDLLPPWAIWVPLKVAHCLFVVSSLAVVLNSSTSGVCCDSTSGLWVAAGGFIQYFPDGSHAMTMYCSLMCFLHECLDSSPIRMLTMSQPTSVQVDANGGLWVVDQTQNTLSFFQPRMLCGSLS